MERARSWRKAAGFIAAAGLALTACGGGSSSLSGDKLSSELDSICKTASRAIKKLDPADGGGYYNDAADVLDTASSDLGDLKVDKADAGDVEDFASLVDDEVKALKDVADAADSGDAAALAAAQADLAGKSADADDIVSDLDASKCMGLGATALAGATVVPPTVTTVAVETTTTVAETTTTPSTLPATTLPVTLPTTVPQTLPPPPVTTAPNVPSGGSITTGNMINDWTAPPGFAFDQDAGDIWAGVIFAPESVDSIAPFIVTYEGGALYSDAGDLYAMAALELTTDFTDTQINDWVTYEASGNGSVVDTPGGLSVWFEPATGDTTYDLYLWIIGKYGMYVSVPAGLDGLNYVDAFTTANFE